MQIPGVDWVVAAVLIAKIGIDMSVFLSVYHTVSLIPSFFRRPRKLCERPILHDDLALSIRGRIRGSGMLGISS